MKASKGLTLIELLFSLILTPFVFLAIYYMGSFTIEKATLYSIRHEMYSQINYALADMELRLPSAMSIDATSLFPAGQNSEEYQFSFKGEPDIFFIKHDTADSVTYTYRIDANNDLVWECDDGRREVLIKSKFSPQVIFKRGEFDEPNFLTVEIQATSSFSKTKGLSSLIVRKTGIRMYYADIVRTE